MSRVADGIERDTWREKALWSRRMRAGMFSNLYWIAFPQPPAPQRRGERRENQKLCFISSWRDRPLLHLSQLNGRTDGLGPKLGIRLIHAEKANGAVGDDDVQDDTKAGVQDPMIRYEFKDR